MECVGSHQCLDTMTMHTPDMISNSTHHCMAISAYEHGGHLAQVVPASMQPSQRVQILMWAGASYLPGICMAMAIRILHGESLDL
eukprot:882063-Karenia_brevis.AAC.1